jgi:stage II sporulation protein D
MRARTLLLTLLAVSLLPGGAASASSKFTIRGAGFGHGVGMSQYGAYGFALNGAAYRDILAHYYTDTSIGTVDPNQRVRVLLQSTTGAASFTGATRAGTRRLSPVKTYYVRRRGPAVQLLSSRRRKMGTYPALRVTGSDGTVLLRGRAANGRVNGVYRGAIDFSAGTFSGVNAINALSLDTYVRGVVGDESPPSWPLEALKAQAVAARTYALTTMRPTAGFDLYPDTRSQVYGGVAAEEASTDQAVAETNGEVVTYQGVPVVTYFFSTSGGRTENVENTPLGNEPKPWLKSVDDPYDDTSPRHRWGPIQMTLKQAGRKLGGLVKGRFRGIEVVQRGVSPRIVEADVIGSRGRVRATGGQLRARFGLFDTWAFFTSITSGQAPPPDPTTDGGAPTGGAQPFGSAQWLRPHPVGSLAGRVLPVLRSGRLTVQVRRGRAWIDAGTARVGRDGRYSYAVTSPGVYRVRYHDENGPAVRVSLPVLAGEAG